MNYIIKATLLVSFVFNSLSVAVAENDEIDKRINLGLSAAEKAEFLKEMNQMLTSIQGILAGLGNEDRKLIIASARNSGN